MALIKTIKEGLKIALGLTALNQGLVAFAHPAALAIYKAFQRKINIRAELLQEYTKLPSDYTALDYLTLAHSIVSNKSTEGGDCKDYSLATYETYLGLVNLNGREDLQEKTRITAGIYEDLGHVMLEVKDSVAKDFDIFKPYETTRYTPLLSINEVKGYTELYKDSYVKEIEIPFTRTTWGGSFFYPTLESFLYPGGMIRVITRTLVYAPKLEN